jgi:hypothetical protein
LKLGKAGITLTHLADEHPDQPEPSCDEGQGTIDGELSESVIHNYSFVRFHYRPSNSCDLQGKTKALVGALVLFLENEVILLLEFFPTSSYSARDHLLDGNVYNDATSDNQSTDDEIVGK